MGGVCGAYGEGRGVHRVLVGKPEGKRPLGRPRRRWEDNIKMDLQEVGGGCGDWTELARDRDRWRALVSTVRNLRVPKMRGISWLAAEPVSFSRRTLLHGVSKSIRLFRLWTILVADTVRHLTFHTVLQRLTLWAKARGQCHSGTADQLSPLHVPEEQNAISPQLYVFLKKQRF